MRFVLLFLIACCAAFGIFSPRHSYAQVETSIEQPHIAFMRPVTKPETVGMAFYKTADNGTPDFRQWAEQTPKTLATPKFDRDVVALSEFNRLQNEYINFELDKPLYIRMPVSLASYSATREILFLEEISPRIYFPFNIYGDDIVVMMKDIGKFSEIQLGGEAAYNLFQAVQNDKTAVVELAVVPELAETERPLLIKDTNYMPMLTRVAEFVIWGGHDDSQALWVWRADWYQPAQNQDLMRLFQQ